MNNITVNFVNNEDGIFLKVENVENGENSHLFDIMTEAQAFDYISENAFKMELEDYGHGPVKLKTDLVCVYVGEHEEFFMSYEDEQLLYDWGVSDEAERLLETELSQFCKAKR